MLALLMLLGGPWVTLEWHLSGLRVTFERPFSDPRVTLESPYSDPQVALEWEKSAMLAQLELVVVAFQLLVLLPHIGSTGDNTGLASGLVVMMQSSEVEKSIKIIICFTYPPTRIEVLAEWDQFF